MKFTLLNLHFALFLGLFLPMLLIPTWSFRDDENATGLVAHVRNGWDVHFLQLRITSKRVWTSPSGVQLSMTTVSRPPAVCFVRRGTWDQFWWGWGYYRFLPGEVRYIDLEGRASRMFIGDQIMFEWGAPFALALGALGLYVQWRENNSRRPLDAGVPGDKMNDVDAEAAG